VKSGQIWNFVYNWLKNSLNKMFYTNLLKHKIYKKIGQAKGSELPEEYAKKKEVSQNEKLNISKAIRETSNKVRNQKFLKFKSSKIKRNSRFILPKIRKSPKSSKKTR
jgi:hypothetical protein